MQNFVFVERIDPKKRNVVERIKDFSEIYEIFNPNEAAGQSDRCIQCGDPYCHNKYSLQPRNKGIIPSTMACNNPMYLTPFHPQPVKDQGSPKNEQYRHISNPIF